MSVSCDTIGNSLMVFPSFFELLEIKCLNSPSKIGLLLERKNPISDIFEVNILSYEKTVYFYWEVIGLQKVILLTHILKLITLYSKSFFMTKKGKCTSE